MNINFVNQPNVESWMSEGEKEFRKNSKTYIREALRNLPLNGSITVKFLNGGVASIVALVSESDDKKMVFKSSYEKDKSLIEAMVLEKWCDLGVRTPKIYSHGIVDGHTYFFMEHVDYPTMKELGDGNFEQLGKILFKIHTIKVSEFGNLTLTNDNLKGKRSDLRDYVLEKSIELSDSIEECINMLGKFRDCTIGHFDFGPQHAFVSPDGELIVFDPDPAANLPIIDLTFLLIPGVDTNVQRMRAVKDIVRSYLNQMKVPYSIDELAAALCINVHVKSKSLLTLPSETRVKRADYMLDKAGMLKNAKNYL